MNPTLREDIAVIGNFGTALIIGLLALIGGIALGPLATLELELLFLGTYITVWGMVRLTTRPLRRPAPAAPATGPDDTEE